MTGDHATLDEIQLSDYDLERATIAAIVADPARGQEAVGRLDPEDFHDGTYRAVFHKIRATVEAGGVPDAVLFDGDRDQISSKLRQVDPSEGRPDNLPLYCTRLRELSLKRQARGVLRQYGDEVVAANGDLRAVLAACLAALADIGSRALELANDLPIQTAQSICQEASSEPRAFARSLCYPGVITLIAAPPKEGKSTFTAAMLRAIIEGKPFLDSETEKTAALCITEEGAVTVRVLLQRTGLHDCAELHVLRTAQLTAFSWTDLCEAIAHRTRELGVGIVVFDTLSKVAGLKEDEENSAGAVQEVIEPLRRMAESGLAVICVQHTRKSGGSTVDAIRGSSAFAGQCDLLVRIIGQGEQQPNRRLLRLSGRIEVPPQLYVEYEDGHYVSLGENAPLMKSAQVREALLSLLDRSDSVYVSIQQLQADLRELKVGKGTVDRTLKALVDEGLVERKTGVLAGHRADAFGYSLVSEQRESELPPY